MITGIVLAAGSGTRFGGTKQLEVVDGRPMVLHAIDALRDAHVDEILVVTGHDAESVEAVLPVDARAVRNPDHRAGQATSLAAGLHAADVASQGAVVLMADQPGVSAEHIRRLIAAFSASRAQIVRLRYVDGPGPALLSREIYGEAGHLHGDTGARLLMASHPEWVREVPIEAPAPPDVDTPGDLPNP